MKFLLLLLLMALRCRINLATWGPAVTISYGKHEMTSELQPQKFLTDDVLILTSKG